MAVTADTAAEARAPEAALDPAEARDWTAGSVHTLGFLSLIYAFNYFDRNLFGLLMPLVKADFKLSDTALALISGMAFILFYSAAGVPIAAGILYPVFGLLLSPIIAAAAMALSSVSVIGNALRLRAVRLT